MSQLQRVKCCRNNARPLLHSKRMCWSIAAKSIVSLVPAWQVPAPFRRTWHPLHSYSHKAHFQRKSAPLRVCASKPEDSEEEKKSQPESRNDKILRKLQAQLKDSQENSSTPEAASKEKEAVGLTMAL